MLDDRKDVEEIGRILGGEFTDIFDIFFGNNDVVHTLFCGPHLQRQGVVRLEDDRRQQTRKLLDADRGSCTSSLRIIPPDSPVDCHKV